MITKTRTENYRKDIDGLRAIAVLSVIGFHSTERLVPGGFFGVDIFFVISGFLITRNILRTLNLSEDSFTLQDFYSRRINRIFPALIVVLLFTIILGWFVLYRDEYKQLGLSIAASSIFCSNLMLWLQSGYFDAGAHEQPLLHLWSLAVEEQFYVLWPVVLIMCWRRSRSYLMVSFLIILSLLVLNLGLSANNETSLAFYFPLSRFWELLSGGLLAHLQTDNFSKTTHYIKSINLNRYWVLLIIKHIQMAGLCLIIGSIFFIESADLLTWHWLVLMPVIGTLFIISLGDSSWIARSVLSNRWLVFVGLISYPLYLWHWPLLWFANTINNGYASIEVRLIVVALAFCFAWITYELIEKPIRAQNTGGIKRKYISIILILILLFLGFIGIFIFRTASEFRNGDNLSVRDISVTEWQKERTRYLNCNGFKHEVQKFDCFRSSIAPPQIAVVGDSHADHLFPGIIRANTEKSWMLLTKGSCPPLLKVRSHRIGERDGCLEAMDQIANVLKYDTTIKTVVLASLGPFYFSGTGFSPEHKGRFGGFSAEQWILSSIEHSSSTEQFSTKQLIFFDGIIRMIEYLESLDKNVVLYMDVPELNFSPRECVQRPLSNISREHCKIEKKIVLARQSEYRKMIVSLTAKHPRLKVFDPLDYLCDSSFCYVSSGNIILYRDGHHLSVRGSEYMAQPLLSFLALNGNTDF